MRKLLPIALLLVGIGCSIPKRHDANLAKKPAIPYVDEVPVGPPLSEGSLWRDRPLIADLRAFRVNDLVTLKISESTNAITKADVTTSRAGSNKLSSPNLFGALAGFGIGSSTSDKATGTTNKFAGTGSTGRSATFTTVVTARVVKVVGNGNLIFEGFRDIQLNNETQRLYVAGMLDPHMLDATNTITSGQVAELRIGYGGQGVVDETLKPGYISRLLAYIWPF
ncbi:MAG: flagellar basal body L-ring protein FlgH [Holophagaceae bacterium]|uniref:Flagellar L-ring protein n=1 Tax=Candidatus Geothrix skivensis TaxID=2954439 RepID=A0A9D7XKE9_9BACT|nr:flagellar basal body L-ring protein FlgH [Candidatus Geothrix skivensis]